MSSAPPLRACAKELHLAVDNIRNASERLRLATTSLSKTARLLTIERDSELLTLGELSGARNALAASVLPQIEDVLRKASEELSEIERERTEMSYEIEAFAADIAEQRDSDQNMILARERTNHLRKERDELRSKKEKLQSSLKRVSDEERQILKKKEEMQARVDAEYDLAAKEKEKMKTIREAQMSEINRKRDHLRTQLENIRSNILQRAADVENLKSGLKAARDDEIKKQRELDSGEMAPSLMLSLYERQRKFFVAKNSVANRGTEFGSCPRNDAFLQELLPVYAKDLERQQALIARTIRPRLEKKRENSLKQREGLLRLFYPGGQMGSTMARVIGKLLESDEFQTPMSDLRKDFPIESDGRHQFTAVVAALDALGLIKKIDSGGDEMIRMVL